MTRKMLLTMLVGAFLFLGTHTANAFVIYDSFNTGKDMDNGVYTFGRPQYSDDRDNGFLFIPKVTTYLDQIVVPVVAYPERENSREAVFWIMTDENGQPGSVIESFYFTAPNGPAFYPSTNFPLTILDSVSHPILYENTPYYLIGSDNFGSTNRPTEETSFAWEIEELDYSQPQSVIAQRNFADGVWFVNSGRYVQQARLSGTPTPEPATIFLFGSGILGTIMGFRRRTVS